MCDLKFENKRISQIEIEIIFDTKIVIEKFSKQKCWEIVICRNIAIEKFVSKEKFLSRNFL